ncbi:uncharacterized protein [Euphorbia lathyris]|uniref:uncharacterized protein isoform X2 n=1 Tax=Euphorbia lathyris TaxID=212925 RepID=UPI003313716D
MTASTTEKPPGLSMDFLPFVDMRTLSQSELSALSFCSSSSFDNFRTDDIVTPIVDRSMFNESTGSHRQTYTRPSSYHHHHHRHRLAGLLPKAPNPPSPRLDSDRRESLCIISFLKKFLSSRPEFHQLDLVEFDSFSHLNDAINFSSQAAGAELPVVNGNYRIGEKKRKRGRKPKVEVLKTEEREREIGLEIVNINGVAVDLVSLASQEDPYKEELSRRTEGMDKEEELLGFFRNLGGQWCSRRRKRKIVDATEFGDTLPVGWKLLLGLKRKEGRAWVYCRRYISPGGQHFLSCKEVSKYLQSFFGHYDALPMRDYAGVNTHQRQSGEHEKAVALLGIENLDLSEVQVHDLFECYKCNLMFDEKDTYLQHLLSFHQRTTRRYRIGGSAGDKMTLQKRSDSPTNDELSARISRMDALIEIAQNSIRETSPDLDQNVAPNPELLASISDHELQSNSSPIGPCIESVLELHQQKVDYMIIDEITQKIDDSDIVLKDKIDPSGSEQHGNGAVPPTLCVVELGKSVIVRKTDKHDDCKSEDVDKTRCVEIEVDFRSNGSVADNNLVKETLQQPLKEDGLSHGVPQLPVALMQPSAATFEIDLSARDKGDDKITGFEDLKLEEIEQLKFSFKTEVEVPMNLVNNSEMERVFDAAAQFEFDLTVDDVGGQRFTTMCVWCGIEFSHEVADTELQSDSVGYMCPACKAKISGTLNMWGADGS